MKKLELGDKIWYVLTEKHVHSTHGFDCGVTLEHLGEVSQGILTEVTTSYEEPAYYEVKRNFPTFRGYIRCEGVGIDIFYSRKAALEKAKENLKNFRLEKIKTLKKGILNSKKEIQQLLKTN